MKGKLLGLVLGFFLVGANLYAADGDLIVNGNLGVGTTTPAYKLDISGDIRWTGILQGGSVPWARLASFPSACPAGQYVTAVGAALTCQTPSGGGGVSITAGSGLSASPNPITGTGTVSLNVANANTWTGAQTFNGGANFPGSGKWNTSGYVGIGTTSPSYKLHVQSGDAYASGYVRGGTGLCIGSDCRTAWPSGSGGVGGSGTANYVSKWTGTSSLGNSLIYDNGTNVGIGTTSPAMKLHVDGGLQVNSNGGTQLVLSSSSSNQWAGVALSNGGSWKWMIGSASDSALTVYDVVRGQHSVYVGSNGDLFFFPSGSGNVGIGGWNASPYKLYVSGSAYSTSGWNSSDMKFKEDITPIDSALSKVMNINGVSFKWKTKEYEEKGFPDGRHYGVIAQEVEKILPEIVQTVKVMSKDKKREEEEKAVSYIEIVPVLIEAIKEQQKEIEKLTAEIEALRRAK